MVAVRNLRQTVTIAAPPAAVYRALVDPKEHAAFTGDRATFEAKPGGRFAHYGDSLVGRVLALEKDRRIVLAWRETGWPESHYSIAQFTLAKKGKGTTLVFEQFGIPSKQFADIREGWTDFYWTPLKAYLEA